MTRTQIQLPDELYWRAKTLAGYKEVSLAELVRNGLEYIIRVSPVPQTTATRTQWTLPKAVDLGGGDPFANPDWRCDIHLAGVAEPPSDYDAAERKDTP